MRYEFYAAIIALATAIVNSFNGNQCTKGEGRASCQCQATCQNGAEIPTSIDGATSEVGTLSYPTSHDQPYERHIAATAGPSRSRLTAGAPGWLVSWTREADRAQRAQSRRAACAVLVSLKNRLSVDEPLAREDRRALQARTENLQELCPYLDEGGT